MADLDDFFAKKDRKKSKGKKFATPDEIAKKLEETGKRSEKLKKDKMQTSQGTGQEVDEQGNTIQQDEDEWRDFEEEKKDYTGLKIQNLTVGEEEGEGMNSGGEDEDGGMEENEAGEMVPKKKQGPWRVMEEQAKDQAKGEPVVEVDIAPSGGAGGGGGGGSGGTTSNPVGSYVPPALRAGARTLQPSSRLISKKKVAPDVRSEELFPSLSAATSQEIAKKKRDETGGGGGGMGGGGGFEEVRNSKSHSARYENSALRAPHRLALGNKFGALNHDQS